MESVAYIAHTAAAQMEELARPTTIATATVDVAPTERLAPGPPVNAPRMTKNVVMGAYLHRPLAVPTSQPPATLASIACLIVMGAMAAVLMENPVLAVQAQVNVIPATHFVAAAACRKHRLAALMPTLHATLETTVCFMMTDSMAVAKTERLVQEL